MPRSRIAADPTVMRSKPCIQGMRITVKLTLRKLRAGRSFAEVLEAYPQLTQEGLHAASAFAADYLQHETVAPSYYPGLAIGSGRDADSVDRILI